MTPGEFKSWRKSLGLKQKDIADLLGLKKRVIQYYEKGRRDGKPVEIPRTVELASYAISAGIGGFNGKETQPIAAPVEPERQMEPAED
jgi:transcriptional regulator with XRE-family HTH domain